jgi:hypothetical protein
MRSVPKWLVLLTSLGLGLGLAAVPDSALAQKPAKAAKKKADKADEKAAEEKATEEKAAEPKKGEAAASDAKAPEGDVKAAGTTATEGEKKKKGDPDVVKVEESEKEEGVKTYQFSAIEVEGRLKSPQIIYFLRRVRAEFEAGMLGHRSFMPELSDTRRSPALR